MLTVKKQDKKTDINSLSAASLVEPEACTGQTCNPCNPSSVICCEARRGHQLTPQGGCSVSLSTTRARRWRTWLPALRGPAAAGVLGRGLACEAAAPQGFSSGTICPGEPTRSHRPRRHGTVMTLRRGLLGGISSSLSSLRVVQSMCSMESRFPQGVGG